MEFELSDTAPVSKKGSKEDPGNYRPVSLMSVPGKVTEIALGVSENHLKDNAVTGHSINGFMRGKRCSKKLISFS